MMNPRWKIVGLAAGVLLTIHLLLSLAHPTYSSYASPSFLRGSSPLERVHDLSVGNLEVPPSSVPRNHTDPNRRKANAVFVVLARNSDLWSFADSMKQMEDRFNWWAGYDYVFLNDEPFDDAFKEHTQRLTNSKCHYGLIEHDHWHQPDWIDEEKATAAREEMIRKKVIYGHSVPYRNMCRFNSGFFFRHPLLASYDYYWRVEPSVKFFCDLAYDPFLVMQDEKKVYGFTLSLFEYIETIPTLWDTVKEFIRENPQYVPEDNAMAFVSDDGGESYNKCHFWSNFEIGDLNFWRGEAYTKFFEHLDKAGGFYYERWGDAPVHSIGAALFAPKDKIHWFSDIGYRHEPFQQCPQGDLHTRGKCWCDPNNDFSFEWYSCTNKYVDMFK
ncbi:hypothetical protein NliqN6_3223 [Naganishia liquefaciens]|uniref:Uncharacterized protein n=1 Tax=Naganishia liquefaciens TaxID=104408 RepID=A0A8H3TSV0_9TREE|nr:hypothetical protein NliqN6_3223 [Naganishia liquefaciens]